MGGAVVVEACSETVGAVKAGMETGSVSLRWTQMRLDGGGSEGRDGDGRRELEVDPDAARRWGR